MNAIFTRRSVRQFSNQVIEEDKIEKILRAAMQAPSGCNQQPWEFIVVRGAKNLEALAKYNPYAGCLTGADAAIVVLGNRERLRMPEFWEQDLGAVTQNILVEATELELGSVWLGTAPDKEKMEFVRKLYKLNDNLDPYSVIALGYPQDKDANRYVDRYDASRVTYICD